MGYPKPFASLSFALAIALFAAPAGAENISTKSLIIKDNITPSKRMVVLQSRDLGITYTDASAPDSDGAWVHVYSATDDHCSYLAGGAEWTFKNSIWKYKNTTTKDQAQLRDGKLLVKLRSAVAFSLADDAPQGEVHVQAQFGSSGTRFCMTCSSPLKDDEKQFRAKDCVAAACDAEPSTCGPAVCGDMEVGMGEECEIDGDCTGGKVCNSGCLCIDPDGCGDGGIDPGEECEADGDCSGGEVCTDRCFCVDPQCPATIDIVQHAGVGDLMTSTDADVGFKGYGHNTDRSDAVPLTLAVSDATESSPASCGVVTVGGIDPSAGNCRCESDTRLHCDQPMANDADNCGGGLCTCFLSPPEPVNFGGTSLCSVRELSDDVTGTWNVDTGAGSLNVPYRLRMHVGGVNVAPCPVCTGDLVRNDGLRGGVCDGGDSDGLSCDANGGDASFPAPGGGEYSYDCLPGAGTDIMGGGVDINETLQTGSTSLSAGLACGFGLSESCPCGTCSGDGDVGCHNNADCAAVSAGQCEGSESTYPNPCSSGTCFDLGGDEGFCDSGPTTTYCDGILQANGNGVYACSSNFQCTPDVIGIDAGTCTSVQGRGCFLSPLVASGTPGVANATLASATCVGPSVNSLINSTLGLPGPIRQRLAVSTSFPCAGAPGSDYPACP